MAILEMQRTQTPTVETEAKLHNAMISERFRRLQDAEANQFSTTETPVRASVSAPVAPSPVRETPTVEQVPQVTEYIRQRMDTPVFTTEKFEGIQNACATVVAPVYAPAMPMPLEVVQPSVATEESYSLSASAKKALAVFGAVVTIMLSVIGVNTQIINKKTVRIRNLERQKQELQEEYEELQERIEAAQSEETIREYALSQGMIQAQG